MSRVNIGKSDQYIEEAKSTDWNINLGSYNLSKATQSLEFEDAISQPGNFTLDLVVDPGEINGGDRLQIDKEGVGAFNGIVTKPERSSQRDDTIKGGGAAQLLADIPINGEFLDTTTQDVVTSVFSQLDAPGIQVGVNEELSDGSGVVDVRAEDEGALKLLNRVVLSHGGEWYVSYNSSSDVFEFNVENKVESGSVQRTFTEDSIKELRDAKVIDEEYDAVVVKGYGDGEDQIVGEYPIRSNWPDDPKVLRYTDKTILSKTEADNTAENIYSEHTDWRNLYLYPANENELLSLGDQVEINDPNTGINNTFRIVQRKFAIDYGQGNGIEYVLSDRPIGLIEEGEDIREQTDSQTDYMQGSDNTFGEKETSNATNAEPLELRFRVTKDVKDKKGRNRTKSIRLNYSNTEFKKNSTNSETQVSSTNVTKADRVKNTNQSSSGRMTQTTDDEDPGVENDNGVDVESVDQSSAGVTGGGGSSIITTNDSSRYDENSVTDEDGWVDLYSSIGGSDPLDGGSSPSAGAVVCGIFIFSPNEGSGFTNYAIDWRLRVTDENGNKYPNSDGIRLNTQHPVYENNGTKYVANDTLQVSVPVPVDTEFKEYGFEIKAASDTDCDVSTEGNIWVQGEHVHDVTPNHEDSNGNFLSAPGSDGSVNTTSRDWVYDVDDSTSSTVDDVSDTTSSTAEDISDTTNSSVVSVNDDILVGNKANQIESIKVDGNEHINDIYGQSNSGGTVEDSDIDITDWLNSDSDGLPEEGWHTVTITPDSATHMKSRVFLEHKKDS